ncbi:MAG: hypothetical protein AB8H79_14925 [Myxococcota bacterium]
MNRLLPVVTLLIACSGGLQTPTNADPDVLDVKSWVEGDLDRGVGTLVVQVRFDDGLDVDLPEPEVTGLRFTEVGAPVQERLGADVVTTRKYRFTGSEGSYEVPALEAVAQVEGEPVVDASDPIWIDMGGETQALEGFEEIAPRAKVTRLSAAWLVGMVCLGVTALAILGAIFLAFWGLSRRSAKSVPPEAPDVVALRRWAAVRSDPSLDDHAKAVAISSIFRDYTEAVLSFPATAATTSEVLAHLGRLAHLPDGNVGRAQRILDATDYIKFADGDARDTLFEELDDALRTFVASTRPRQWEAP